MEIFSMHDARQRLNRDLIVLKLGLARNELVATVIFAG